MTDADSFAFTEKANEQRRAKAVHVARFLYSHGVTPHEAESLGDDERKRALYDAGKARTDVEKPKPLYTSHPDELWRLVILALRHKYEHERLAAEAIQAPPAIAAAPVVVDVVEQSCGCTTGPGVTITDQAAHDRWHALVVEQGGPAGAVNMQTLRVTRGGAAWAPDMHSIAERHRKQGKTASRELRAQLRS